MATIAAFSQQIWDKKYRLRGRGGEVVDKTVEDSWCRRACRARARSRRLECTNCDYSKCGELRRPWAVRRSGP